MAEVQPGDGSRSAGSGATSTRRKSTKKARSSDGSDGPTRASSATEPNLLGLEQPPAFEPPDDAPPVRDAREEIEYEPPLPEPVEWTAERAGAIFRGGAFLLHAADPLSREPGGAELWRATADDVDAIGPPLARILNRYAPARQLAGFSDEGELAFGMLAYAKRNLGTRGRLVAAKKAREEEPDVWAPADAGGGEGAGDVTA